MKKLLNYVTTYRDVDTVANWIYWATIAFALAVNAFVVLRFYTATP